MRISTRRLRGAAGNQYTLVVGLMAVVCIAAVTTAGSGVRGMMQNISNSLSNVGPAVPPAPPPPPPYGIPTFYYTFVFWPTAMA